MGQDTSPGCWVRAVQQRGLTPSPVSSWEMRPCERNTERLHHRKELPDINGRKIKSPSVRTLCKEIKMQDKQRSQTPGACLVFLSQALAVFSIAVRGGVVKLILKTNKPKQDLGSSKTQDLYFQLNIKGRRKQQCQTLRNISYSSDLELKKLIW